MIYFCGGRGGGTTVLVLCIGIESRIHMTHWVVVVVVLVVPLYCYYVLVFSQGFRWHILLLWLRWGYHCIGIMYFFLVQTLQFNVGSFGGGGYGGGICIMHWFWVKTSHNHYNCGGCCGGTNVLVLCVGIGLRLQMTYTIVMVVVMVPLYWYYVLVLSLDFSWQIQYWW